MTSLSILAQDIIDPDLYTTGVPHATFKQMRDEDPVCWVDEKDGSGFWAITRYDDLLEASKRPKLFSSSKGIRIEDMAPDELEARKTLMELDPPDHTSLRRLVNPPFLPRSVKAYTDDLRTLTNVVLDDLQGATEFDFVTRIARVLPMRMLGKLMGVPDEDGKWLVSAGDALIGNSDPEFTDFPVDLVDTEEYRLLPFRSPVSLKLFDYAGAIRDERRKCPMDDITTRLTGPLRDGSELSEIDFKNFFTLLVAAGNDTTRYTMAAGLQALFDFPEEMARLKDDLSLIDTAVEEMLRWGSVTMHFRRTALEDYALNGKEIRAGDKLLLWYISADFDERQFPDPYRFDVSRTPNRHVAFGLKNPHKCLGEHLARLEIKVLYEELLQRVKSIEPNGPTERLRSNFIAGIKHMPVRVEWK
ncbi:MAG: cytochrome P450 [Chloroflexota bacterium]